MLFGLLAFLVAIGIASTEILLIPFHIWQWIHLPLWFVWLPIGILFAWCLRD
jgi:hypothetical protein